MIAKRDVVGWLNWYSSSSKAEVLAVADIIVRVPELTVFELISSASGICTWNPLLELLGTVDPVSAVVSRLHGRSKLNSRKLLCQIHLYL